MNTEKTVTIKLTEDQANTLACYILMTTNHRKGERDAWLSLAEERNTDGSQKFIHASSNAAYYEELERQLTEIRHIIDNSY